jgi:hypothetical protein
VQKKSHVRVADIRGTGRLVIDAAVGLTRIVETMHHNILRAPAPLGAATQQPVGGITGFVYKSIRGGTRLVGRGIDAVLGRFARLFDGGASSTEREAVLAALNGVLGDHLQASRNPLAIDMQFRHAGRPLETTRAALAAAFPHASGRVLVLAHGLCMNDLQWRRNGHDHGAALAAATGCTPVYLHYNSGLHVSTNGHALARRLEALLHAWPAPVEQLAIVGFSMGGLVARSACHYAERARHAWRRHLRTLVFLGTPHHGAPLERGGHWIDAILDASPYTTAFARLGKARSAGITDLRHGSVLDDDWKEGGAAAKRPILALPHDVDCYAIAASISRRPGRIARHLLGDGLVPLASALGEHADPRRDLGIPATRRWVGYGMHHLDLLDSRQACRRLVRWGVGGAPAPGVGRLQAGPEQGAARRGSPG